MHPIYRALLKSCDCDMAKNDAQAGAAGSIGRFAVGQEVISLTLVAFHTAKDLEVIFSKNLQTQDINL